MPKTKNKYRRYFEHTTLFFLPKSHYKDRHHFADDQLRMSEDTIITYC